MGTVLRMSDFVTCRKDFLITAGVHISALGRCEKMKF